MGGDPRGRLDPSQDFATIAQAVVQDQALRIRPRLMAQGPTT